MPFVYFFTNLHIPNLAIMQPGRPSRIVARNGFVNNKQMAFLTCFISQQLLFLFIKHLDTRTNLTDCEYGQTNFCYILPHCNFIWLLKAVKGYLYLELFDQLSSRHECCAHSSNNC